MLEKLIRDSLIENGIEGNPLYVYDITDYRINIGYDDVEFDYEDLKESEGFEGFICDYEFVVSSKKFPKINLIYSID